MSLNPDISTQSDFQGGTVLIIDDEPAIVNLISVFLRELGSTILTAQNGEDGLAKAHQNPPDLILLDVLMPGIDGFETCRRLKQDEATQTIPVIFVTAVSGLPEVVRAFALGAVDYITKPLRQEEVVARVMTHLRLRKLHCELQEQLARQEHMEQKLRESEALFRATFEEASIGIGLTDMQGKMMATNQALQKMLGYSAAEFQQMSITEFTHPDDVSQTISFHQELSSGKHLSHQLEKRYLHKNGQIVWGRLTASLIRDQAGQPSYNIGVIEDITERKQMEETLRRSEERFALAVQASNDGIWDWNLLDNSLYWSPHMIEMCGYDPDEFEVSFEKYLSLLHPDEVQPLSAAIEAHLKDGTPYLVEQRLLTKSGEYRWFRGHGQVVRDETGRPVRMVGSTTDIHERKQMEETLSEERNLLRSVINATPDWIFVRDEAHRFRLVNQSLASVYGLNPEDMVGKTDLELGLSEEIVNGNPVKGIRGYWADDLEVMQTGQRKDILEDPHIFGDQLRILRTVKVPLWDEKTQTVGGVLAFIHDITDLKQTQAELQQAKEEAEAATRVKSEFLANMSHEIRTPLNAIIGMTSLLLDTALSPEQHDFAETIRTSGDGLLTIINDILDFSKIEAGKLELEKQPFDLHQCIEEAFDLITVKATEKKLDLAYLVDDLTPGVLVGDVTRLRQILVNLLTNAVKFTEQGEIVVSVTSSPLKNDPAETLTYEIHFAVRDTGLGVPPERQDRLFQSFSQIDASTTRKYGGTGLGLTICRRLVEMMGGRMWVESEGIPGRGSTFYFTLLAQAAAIQPDRFGPGEQTKLSGKSLLIVDDNATNRFILTRYAQSWGMQPRAVASGPEALARLIQGESFALAILDMHMPEMDGLMLAAAIRRIEASRVKGQSRIPLIMLTSLGAREIGDQASGAEFAAFLTKPIKSSHLYNALLNVVAGQQVKIKSGSNPSSGFEPSLGQTQPLRILLAEDNVINQKVALQLLKRIGYSADVAANGLEVLQALKRQVYDVVLMDVQMPEMDGLEATRRILQQGPHYQRPWIIAMTANALQGDRERCLEAGMNDYISKPVRPEELRHALLRSQPHSRQTDPTINLELTEVQDPGSPTPSRGPVLDPQVFAEMVELLEEGGPQVVVEFIDIYLGSAVSLIDQMRKAVPKKDGPGLSMAAHSLKPSSAQFGAIHLSALCKELEIIGKSGQLEESATAKLAELEAEFSLVQEALMAEKNRFSDA